MKYKYITIDGVIGAGKTTLAKMLANKFNGTTLLEVVEENPFLADFYQDRKRFAFQTQLFFLLSRYRQQQNILQQDLFHNILISDYLFAKDKIFAYQNLEDRELFLYEKILVLLERDIVKPDLVIYLKSSSERLMKNIQLRGRSFEREISFEYIDSLNKAYNRFFNFYKETTLLTVNATEIDFVNNKNEFEKIVQKILDAS